jgi:integrase
VRIFESDLKVDGWNSQYITVQRFLEHYARKTKSESTRENILSGLDAFLKFCGELNPDLYVKNTKSKVEKQFQAFLDDMKKKDRSIRYINMNHAFLSTFFELNGFKNGKSLEVERYHQPARYRKKAEYIPTNDEAWRLIQGAGSPMNQAILAAIYTSGLRNSTMRALLYGDVRADLEAAKEIIMMPVYPEMKKIVPDACKNSIPYFSFISKEATRLVRNYIAYAQSKYGQIKDKDPLFIGEKFEGRLTHLRSGTVEVMVHRAAFRANLSRWEEITVKCLRTAFQNVLKSEFVDGKGRMDEKDQEFLMGHILPGSEDHYYDATKMESLRLQYARLPFAPAEPSEATKSLEARTVDLKTANDSMKKIITEQGEKLEQQGQILTQLAPILPQLGRILEEIKKREQTKK